jgi:hypothetical protein
LAYLGGCSRSLAASWTASPPSTRPLSAARAGARPQVAGWASPPPLWWGQGGSSHPPASRLCSFQSWPWTARRAHCAAAGCPAHPARYGWVGGCGRGARSVCVEVWAGRVDGRIVRIEEVCGCVWVRSERAKCAHVDGQDLCELARSCRRKVGGREVPNQAQSKSDWQRSGPTAPSHPAPPPLKRSSGGGCCARRQGRGGGAHVKGGAPHALAAAAGARRVAALDHEVLDATVEDCVVVVPCSKKKGGRKGWAGVWE